MNRSMLSLLPFVAGALCAQPLKLHLEPAQTEVTYTLGATMHAVHGTFKLERGEFTFDPVSSTVSGELVVDAASGTSGSADRDRRMHESILETPRYPTSSSGRTAWRARWKPGATR